VTQKKAIAPLEYLRSLPRETIQRAYHESTDASFSKEGDRQAAEVLTRYARLQDAVIERYDEKDYRGFAARYRVLVESARDRGWPVDADQHERDAVRCEGEADLFRLQIEAALQPETAGLEVQHG
jgi:hypothetical protein